MKKKSSIFASVAEAINDFSLHRINRIELYEIICNYILESTNEDKELVANPDGVEASQQYDIQFAKNWLMKK